MADVDLDKSEEQIGPDIEPGLLTGSSGGGRRAPGECAEQPTASAGVRRRSLFVRAAVAGALGLGARFLPPVGGLRNWADTKPAYAQTITCCNSNCCSFWFSASYCCDVCNNVCDSTAYASCYYWYIDPFNNQVSCYERCSSVQCYGCDCREVSGSC